MTEDQESLLQNTVDSLQQQVKLRRKIRAVALLLCLVGLPEGTEGFLEKWLLELLGQESFTNLITTGRANPLYRTVETKHSQNTHYALEFKDKDKVLQIVWAKGKVTYKECEVLFFLQDIARRAMNMRYGTIFPAKLRIMHTERDRIFESPDEVKVSFAILQSGRPNKGKETVTYIVSFFSLLGVIIYLE